MTSTEDYKQVIHKSWGDYSSDEEELILDLKPDEKLIRILPLDSDIEILYSYLLDVNSFIFENVKDVLDSFELVNYSYLRNSLDFIDIHDFIPDYLTKHYFKMRHNVFGFIIKDAIGEKNFLFETDVLLSEWIDSKKTPDYIFFGHEKNFVIDFMVSNSYENLDYRKGGGISELKYTKECELLSESFGKPTEILIIAAILNTNNSNEIKELLKTHFDVELNLSLIDRFFSICTKYLSKLNEIATKSLNPLELDRMIPYLGEYDIWYDRPQRFLRTDTLSADFISRFHRDKNYLMSQVVSKNLVKDQKGIIIYQKDQNKFHFELDPFGIDKNILLSYLDQGDLGSIMSSLLIRDGRRRIGKEHIKGNVAITYQVKKKVFVPEMPYINSNITNFYLKKTASFSDDYGTPNNFNLASFSNLRRINGPVLFEENYKSLLSSKLDHEILIGKDTEKHMLISNKMNENVIDESLTIFKDEWYNKNEINFFFNPKQSFAFPIPTIPLTYGDLETIPEGIFLTYVNFGSGSYTRAILNKMLAGKFCDNTQVAHNQELIEMRDGLSEVQRLYYRTNKDFYGQFVKSKVVYQSKNKEIIKLLETVNSKRKSYVNKLRESTKTIKSRLIKINCSKKSPFRKYFEAEMSHFNKSGSEFKGVGMPTEDTLKAGSVYFTDLLSRFLEKDFTNTDFPKPYNTTRSPGPEFLNDQKNEFTESWNDFYEKNFKHTLLEQMCHFISKLSETLFNESVRTFNKDYIKFDNLGFSNFACLIRGGPKIYKNQRSKLFKCFFLIKDIDVMFSGYRENQAFEIIPFSAGNLIITPWMQIHQDVLLDGLTLTHRTFMNLYVSQTRMNIPIDEGIPRTNLMPFMLFLHNRRKTESFMHNCRYLIVNLLGSYANLTGIIKNFATFNYTYFDSWLKHCLIKNYKDFSSNMFEMRSSSNRNPDIVLKEINLCNLWTGDSIVNSDQLTAFIYSTYMMSKAPVNSSVEQVSNLWTILEDVKLFDDEHHDVNGMDDVSLRFDLLLMETSVYHDDFKYDPKFCQYLGFYLGGLLENNLGSVRISNEWDSILNQSIDTIANSKGLRGWDNKNYFNKKSFEIVYEHVEKLLKSKKKNVKDLISEYDTMTDLQTSIEMVNNDKVTFRDVEDCLENLTFHVVHKIQRGGNREIFCMDLGTKLQQNPLEKFFKKLCKVVHNEFISVSSSMRTGMLHTEFFEKGPGAWVKQIVRWVLDCRRWAPHSVFQKYVHFIYGMSPILPTSFLTRFYNFSNKMFQKRFVTRTHVIDKMKNNAKFNNYEKFVKTDKHISGMYYFHAKFSFVMGIFNYLSSLMHASNQLLNAEVIKDYSLSKGMGLCILNPKCHSDDSVVTSYHEKVESIEPSLCLYDWLLKGANHMLSVKKSQINNNVYMEFLSILYLYDRLLPVVPKFYSTIPFKPSDLGYSADIGFAVTQSIEMMSNGGSFEESFLILKLTENFIQSIYKMKSIPNLPHQFLGGIDSHPIELLLMGTDAELYRHLKYNPTLFNNSLKYLQKEKIVKEDDTASINIMWDMGARINFDLKNKFKKTMDTNVGFSDSWTLSNNKLGNQFLNLIWFTNKLHDNKFYSSLMSEPDARRYSRIFGSSRYRNLKTYENSLLSVQEVIKKLSTLAVVLEDINMDNNYHLNVLTVLGSDLQDFYDAIENCKIKSRFPNNKKDKPILFVSKEPNLGRFNIGTSEFVTYIKEPNMVKYLGRHKDYSRQAKNLKELLNLFSIDVNVTSPDDLFKLTNKIIGRDSKSFRMITCVEGNNRVIDSLSKIISLIETNSVRNILYEIRAPNARIIDWNRRLVSGKLPILVIEFIKAYIAMMTMNKYDINDHDIFKIDMQENLDDLMTKIPREWLIILKSATSQFDFPLCEQVYWSFWSKEQIKLGNYWYGEGQVLLSIPEGVLKIQILNGVVTFIELSGMSTGYFCDPTSWYLRMFFSQNGCSMSLMPSEFGVPDKLYLGVKKNSNNWGFGLSRNFDEIFDFCELVDDLLPLFTRESLPSKRVRGHVVYEYMKRDIKIYHFLPEQENLQIDIDQYIDKTKLKKYIKDPKIVKFCRDLAIDYNLTITFDKETLLDNIAKTKLYKIVWNHPDVRTIWSGEIQEDSFLESLIMWKKTHVEFGFPDMDELVKMHKSDDVPPLPYNVQKFLFKLGKTEIDETILNDIILKVTSLTDEDRHQFIANVAQTYGGEIAVNMLTILSRSKRIYISCKILGLNTMRILSPLLQLVIQILDDHKIFSASLENLKEHLNRSYNLHYSSARVLKDIISITLINCILINESLSSLSKPFNLLMNILKEFISSGLKHYLNLDSSFDPILRTIDFSIDDEMLINFFIDLFDSVCLCTWKMKMKSVPNESLIWVSEGVLQKNFLFFQKNMMLLKFNILQNEILFTKYRKGKTPIKYKLKICKNWVSGVVNRPFQPQTEESLEEFDDGRDFDSEAEDNVEFDDDVDIPEFAYVYKHQIDISNLQDIRGTAKNLIIYTSSVNKNMLSPYRGVFIYKKTHNSNYKEYFHNIMHCLCLVTSSKYSNIEIEGYTKLNHEDMLRYLEPSKYRSESLIIDGKVKNKLIFSKNPAMAAKYFSIDNYFGLITKEQKEKQVEKIEEVYESAQDWKDVLPENVKTEVHQVHKLILTKYKEDPEFDPIFFEKFFLKYPELMGKIELEEEKHDTQTSVIPFDFHETLKNMVSKIDQFNKAPLEAQTIKGKTGIAHEVANVKPKKMRFKDPSKVLTDIEVKTELDTFLPGYWDKLCSGEIFLRKITMDMKIKWAKMNYESVPTYMKKKYQRLLLIIKFIFSMVNVTKDRSKEDLSFANVIEELFYVEEEGSEGEMEFGMMYPDNEDVILELDVDTLFTL